MDSRRYFGRFHQLTSGCVNQPLSLSRSPGIMDKLHRLCDFEQTACNDAYQACKDDQVLASLEVVYKS
jgi:hypothetical protein